MDATHAATACGTGGGEGIRAPCTRIQNGSFESGVGGGQCSVPEASHDGAK